MTAREHVTLNCLCLWCVDARSANGRTPCPRMELDPHWAATVVLKDLERLGDRKVILRSDQEKSLKALAQAVKNAWTGEIISIPLGDCQGSGEMERAVQPLHEQARTLKESLNIAVGVTDVTEDPRSTGLAWLIEHARTLLNLFHPGAPYDGWKRALWLV